MKKATSFGQRRCSVQWHEMDHEIDRLIEKRLLLRDAVNSSLRQYSPEEINYESGVRGEARRSSLKRPRFYSHEARST